MGERATFKELARGFRDLARVCVKLEAAFGDLAAEPVEPKPRQPRAASPALAALAPSNPGPADELTKSERRLLTALAQMARPLTNHQIGTIAGVSHGTGPFSQTMAALRRDGYVVTEQGRNTITNAGTEALGTYARLPEGIALFEHWCEKLGGSKAKVLRALLKADRDERVPLDRAGLGEYTGLSTGTGPFSQALATLRRLELVEDVPGGMQLSRELREAIEPTIGVYDTRTGKTVRVKAGHR